MPGGQYTTALHLALGDDERQNRNWDLIDAALRKLGKGMVLPDDVEVLGSLTVTGNADIAGQLTTGQIATGLLTATGITVQGPIEAQGAGGSLAAAGGLLISGGSVILPDQSLDGADFQKNATVQSFQTSTANTAQVTIPVGPGVVLNSLTMDATEEDGRTQLVVAQVTLTFAVASDTTVNGNVILSLRRGSDVGSNMVQARTIPYGLSRAGTIAVPVTMVRVGPPAAGDQRRWAIWAVLNNTPGLALVNSTFAQLHCLQLR